MQCFAFSDAQGKKDCACGGLNFATEISAQSVVIVAMSSPVVPALAVIEGAFKNISDEDVHSLYF